MKKRARKTARRNPSAYLATPPAQGVPSPPAGFDTASTVPRGATVWAALVTNGSAGSELAAAPAFAKDFGEKQDPAALALALETASAWRRERQKTKDWHTYVAINDVAAWTVVAKELERFRQAFDYAATCDPTLRARYPQMDALLRARSQGGVRAGVTRRKNAGAKAEAAASEATAAPPSPPGPSRL